MERTNIPVSKETRRELRILKAEYDCRSYDELLREFLDGTGEKPFQVGEPAGGQS